MEKINPQSPAFTDRNTLLERLRAAVPEAFSDGKFNLGILADLVGDVENDNNEPRETFGLNWSGKSTARRAAMLQPRESALRPALGEGIREDETQNIFIEGDNLETLRLLRHAYSDRIKIIYIDPPYNTGNDFIYKDNFIETAATYQERTGQNTHPKSSGRFHSNWLNFLYPRLRIAKDLLHEDGVIFVSIDDHELANLKLVLDEIFGEDNFIDIFNWTKTETPANLSKKSKKVIEYILCYQKTRNHVKFTGIKKNSPSSNGLLNQTNKPNILKFPANVVKTRIPNQVIPKGFYGTDSYEIELLEDTKVENGFFVEPIVLKSKFKWSQKNLENELKKGTQISIPTLRLSPSYEKLEYDAEVPPNLINSKVGVGTNENASDFLENLMGFKAFDFPKPVSLIQYLLQFSNDKNAIVLDFFAGSGTTAQAVLELNQADGGQRQFILVQLAEPIHPKTLAAKAGFENIAEITRARICKVIEKMQAEKNAKLDPDLTEQDLGFRALRLGASNFRSGRDFLGDSVGDDFNRFEKKVNEPLVPGWKASDLLAELALLEGFPLHVRPVLRPDLGSEIWEISANGWREHRLLVCLAEKIAPILAENLQKTMQREDVFICLALDDETKLRLDDAVKLKVI